MVEKLNGYITTASGIHFYPSAPIEKDIHIEDIAHALCYMCRANGHFKHFYSVAQHSINCTKEAKSRGYNRNVQLACLLHDASEAYMSDVTRPLKAQLLRYCEIEENLQSLIYKHFIGTDFDKKKVHSVDMSIFYYEFINLLNEIPDMETPVLKSIPNFNEQYFSKVKIEFLHLYNTLTQPETEPGTFIGVDISKGKWIAVIINNDTYEIQQFSTIKDIISLYEDADSIIVDIPIGLPETLEEYSYRPDTAARKFLSGNRKSSIFSVPCRQAVWVNNIKYARDINKKILGKSISSQGFGMQKYLRDIDSFLQHHPQYKNKVLESHPEVAFAVLNNGISIDESKLTEQGLNQRIEILSKYYPIANELKQLFKNGKYPKSIRDDIVDAFSLALVGYLGKMFGTKSIPEHPKKDSQGILMQMIVPEI